MIDIVSETKTTALTGSELANATTAARLLKKNDYLASYLTR